MMRFFLEKMTKVLGFTLPVFSVVGFWCGTKLLGPHSSIWALALNIGITFAAMQAPAMVFIYWSKFERQFLLYEALSHHVIFGTRQLRFRTSIGAMLLGLALALACSILHLPEVLFWYFALPLWIFHLSALLAILACYAWCSRFVRRHSNGYVTVMRMESHILSHAGRTPIQEVWPIAELSELFLTNEGYVLSREEIVEMLSQQPKS